MENTPPPDPNRAATQAEVSPQFLTPEQKPVIRRKDILAAPDAATALGAYQAARKEKDGDRASDLMSTMGEKLLQLGQVEPALQWTLASEQVRTAEKMGTAQEMFAHNVDKFGNKIVYLDETVDRFGGKTRGLDETVDRFGRATSGLDQTVDRFGQGVKSFNEPVEAMGSAARRISNAADVIGRR